MMTEEYIKENFNSVDALIATYHADCSLNGVDYPELEIGKTYQVSHLGVSKSFSHILLVEFPGKEYDANCFELHEYGMPLKHTYTQDPRFWAPCLRKLYRQENPKFIAEQIEKVAIPAHLRTIEHQHDVKVLLAVESGSRAWGFESNNSDWDVRFIYVHKPKWYFKIEEQRDVIEYMYEDDVDLAGWELRKALSLLRKSNPSLLEWFHSPKIYYLDDEFANRIYKVERDFFHPVKAMYHYNRIYNKHNERYLHREGYHMKRFLYYLRGILACQWIEANKTIPPVRFKELYEAMVSDVNIKAKIEQLLAIKKKGQECDLHIVDSDLVEYAQKLADNYNASVNLFRPEQRNASADVLDTLLYDMVKIHS